MKEGRLGGARVGRAGTEMRGEVDKEREGERGSQGK